MDAAKTAPTIPVNPSGAMIPDPVGTVGTVTVKTARVDRYVTTALLIAMATGMACGPVAAHSATILVAINVGSNVKIPVAGVVAIGVEVNTNEFVTLKSTA